jgi:LmbE family N-acetylglucosaminyl deacetylase
VPAAVYAATYTPWFLDGHDDHRAVNLALARCRFPAGVEVWAFETWTPLPANRVVDISSVLDRKEQAIAAHRTAHQAFDPGAVVGLNRYRSLHGLLGRGHAEAFLAAPAPEYVALVERYSDG